VVKLFVLFLDTVRGM